MVMAISPSLPPSCYESGCMYCMCEIQQSLAIFFISRLGHANIVLMFRVQEFLVPDLPTGCGHSSSVSPTVSTLRAGTEEEEEEKEKWGIKWGWADLLMERGREKKIAQLKYIY